MSLTHDEIMRALLHGLPEQDQRALLGVIGQAHGEQLTAKRNPKRRRRRNQDGELEERPPRT